MGGNNRTIPLYVEPKNSPFTSNQEKILKTKYEEGKEQNFQQQYIKNDQSRYTLQDKKLNNPMYVKGTQPGQPKPILDLQVYPQEQARPKMPDPQLWMPVMNSSFAQIPNYNIPVIKNINISAGGPIGDHARLATIIEDVLPVKDIAGTPNTVGERLTVYQFVRSQFMNQGDGQEVDISGNSDKSILKYIKPLELNPNNPSAISNNPYIGLPDNMIVYKACYPQRLVKEKNTTQCAKDSIGAYVKIYGLSVAEYNTRTLPDNAYYLYDNWREVTFYEYVREHIIKLRVCPNFPIMFGWTLNHGCQIDFVKLNMYKNTKLFTGPSTIGTGCGSTTVNNVGLPFTHSIPQDKINPTWASAIMKYYGSQGSQTIPIVPYGKNDNNAKKQYYNLVAPLIATNAFLTNYSGNALVTLSEAPTQSLISWASKKYMRANDNKTSAMINTGSHDSATWKCMIFQMLVALATLQTHKIAFRELTIQDNFYVQDTKTNTNTTDYWKYIINGIEYYVPNYGYLLIFDSNFRDIKSEYSLKPQTNKAYKIVSTIYDDQDKGIVANVDDIQRLCLSNASKILDPNIFSGTFLTNGGTKPPEDVIKLLDDIHKKLMTVISSTSYQLRDLIYEFMRPFMNNRIGTILKYDEVVNIQKSNKDKFNPGQIIIREFASDTYEFVLFKNYIDDNNCEILFVDRTGASTNTSGPRKYTTQQVTTNNLYHYSSSEKINQDFNNKMNFGEDFLIETYTLNNF